MSPSYQPNLANLNASGQLHGRFVVVPLAIVGNLDLECLRLRVLGRDLERQSVPPGAKEVAGTEIRDGDVEAQERFLGWQLRVVLVRPHTPILWTVHVCEINVPAGLRWERAEIDRGQLAGRETANRRPQ